MYTLTYTDKHKSSLVEEYKKNLVAFRILNYLLYGYVLLCYPDLQAYSTIRSKVVVWVSSSILLLSSIYQAADQKTTKDIGIIQLTINSICSHGDDSKAG